MDERIVEEARFVALAKVRQARGMTAEEKFRAGSELFDDACRWMEAAVADSLPGATAAERQREISRRWRIAEMLRR